MLIIIDKKIADKAGQKLIREMEILTGEETVLLELETHDLVYPAISGHPDIFFCSSANQLIIAPNLPSRYSARLEAHGITYTQGLMPVGEGPHPSAYIHYNAALGNRHLVHRLEYTDPLILESHPHLKKIPVKQGYSRCNLLFLNDDRYITSDRGIDEALRKNELDGIFVSPEGIVLPGFTNGFIGGTMGVLENRVFILGSLRHYPCGELIKNYLDRLHYKVVELFDGPLFDGGSILFLSSHNS